jgi:hypothetical protein
VFENVLCCDDEEKSREKQIKFKVRVLAIRILFGFLTNIAVFISICVINRDTFIDNPTALGLFCIIILHIVILYGTVTVYLLCSSSPETTEEFDEDIYGPRTMTAYRFHEIIFDLLVLFYSLVLSEWEMTEFATATTVLSCLDIVVNCVILGRNWHDVCKYNRSERRCLEIINICTDCAPAGVLWVIFLPCCLCSLCCLLCEDHNGEKGSRREENKETIHVHVHDDSDENSV